MTDVDSFIWKQLARKTPEEFYAAWFFMLHRLPAANAMNWQELIEPYKLFCTYKGKRYRVTGASRMGDIWLHSKLDWTESTSPYYEHRVDLDDCSGWSKDP
jgi:hypothetical protein